MPSVPAAKVPVEISHRLLDKIHQHKPRSLQKAGESPGKGSKCLRVNPWPEYFFPSFVNKYA